MLNEIKLHREFIEVPYMNSRKFKLLNCNIEQLSVECSLSEQVESYLLKSLKVFNEFKYTGY